MAKIDYLNKSGLIHLFNGIKNMNVASATRLANSRKINGVEFDGTKDITIAVPTKTSQLQNDSGFLSSIPVASSTVLGGVKVGNGLSISNGTLSVNIDKIIENKILEMDKKKYPVGKIIMSTANVNPSTYLGFGTWVAWGSGRVPVGVNTAEAEFNTVEKTGGEKAHRQTLEELCSHNHTLTETNVATMAASGNHELTQEPGGRTYLQIGINYTGGSQPMNILQPYITCYMWKRTA